METKFYEVEEKIQPTGTYSIRLETTPDNLEAVKALQLTRAQDEDCMGFGMSTEITEKGTLIVTFNGIHPAHLDRFEPELSKIREVKGGLDVEEASATS